MDNELLKLLQLVPTVGRLTIASIDIGSGEKGWSVSLGDYETQNQSLRQACQELLKLHQDRMKELHEAFSKLV